MAIEYFCCYHSYAKKLAKLSDQEVGRLFRALLEYSSTGEAQELTGRESVAFDFIADDIDRAKANYERQRKQNSENGKKGGRPANRPLLKKAVGFSESEKSQNKNENKNEDETNTPPPNGGRSEVECAKKRIQPPPAAPRPTPTPPETSFGPELQAAFDRWLAYKRERRDAYKPTGLSALVTQIQRNAAQYGEKAVAELIESCMANGWRGIIWDKLQPGKTETGRSGNIFAQIAREEGLI